MSLFALAFIAIKICILNAQQTCVVNQQNICYLQCSFCLGTIHCEDGYSCKIDCIQYNACTKIEAVHATSVDVNCAPVGSGKNCNKLIVNGQNAGNMTIDCTGNGPYNACSDAQINCGTASCQLYCSSISCVNVTLNASLSASYNCFGNCTDVTIIAPDTISTATPTSNPIIITTSRAPSSDAPTTVNPTTMNPTTMTPTTMNPTTMNPTTMTPTTMTPTTMTPTTMNPTTMNPTTMNPTISDTNVIPVAITNSSPETREPVLRISDPPILSPKTTAPTTAPSTQPSIIVVGDNESKSGNLMTYIIIITSAVVGVGCILCGVLVIFAIKHKRQYVSHQLTKSQTSLVELVTVQKDKYNVAQNKFKNGMIEHEDDDDDDDDEEMYMNDKTMNILTTKTMNISKKEDDDSIEEIYRKPEKNEYKLTPNTRLIIANDVEGSINKMRNGMYIKEDDSDSITTSKKEITSDQQMNIKKNNNELYNESCSELSQTIEGANNNANFAGTSSQGNDV